MNRLAKVLYWLLAVPTGVLALIVVMLTITGQRLSSATPDWLAYLAAGAVLALLAWGYTLAASGGRPFRAVLVVVLSWVLFSGVMIVNGVMHQTNWN